MTRSHQKHSIVSMLNVQNVAFFFFPVFGAQWTTRNVHPNTVKGANVFFLEYSVDDDGKYFYISGCWLNYVRTGGREK